MLTQKEKLNIGLLILLYFIQGIIIAFPLRALNIILINQNFSLKDLSLLALCSLPFTIKILWAPFLDSYYIKSIGKRKSYICPILLVLVLLVFYFGYNMTTYIQERNISSISYLAITVVFLAAVQDVAIDGWVTNLFYTEANRTYASSCQTIGQNIGWFCSEHFFIWLYSKEYLSVSGYTSLVSLLMSVLFVYTTFFKKEHDCVHQYQHQNQNGNSVPQSYITENSEQQFTVTEVLKNLIQFYKNPQLRFLCIVFLCYRIGFSPIDTSGYLKLIENGFPKEQWSKIGIIVFPIQLIVPFLTGKYLTAKNKEMRYFTLGLMLKFVDSLLFTYSIYMYENYPSYRDSLYYMLFLNVALQQTANTLIFVITGAFAFKIQDEEAGGTYVTMLFSLLNFGKFAFEPITLYLVDSLSFVWLSFLGLLYELLFIVKCKNRIEQLDNIKVSNFSLLISSNINSKVNSKKNSNEYTNIELEQL